MYCALLICWILLSFSCCRNNTKLAYEFVNRDLSLLTLCRIASLFVDFRPGRPTRRPYFIVFACGFWTTSPFFISLNGRRYVSATCAFCSSAQVLATWACWLELFFRSLSALLLPNLPEEPPLFRVVPDGECCVFLIAVVTPNFEDLPVVLIGLTFLVFEFWSFLTSLISLAALVYVIEMLLGLPERFEVVRLWLLGCITAGKVAELSFLDLCPWVIVLFYCSSCLRWMNTCCR